MAIRPPLPMEARNPWSIGTVNPRTGTSVGLPIEAANPWAAAARPSTPLPAPPRTPSSASSTANQLPATPSAALTLAQILAGDPFYQANIASMRGASASDRAGLRASRQRALTLFGEVPDFGQFAGTLGEGFGSDIDATTRAGIEASNRSGVSTKARLAGAHADAVNEIRRNLLARGMSDSGEQGWMRGREAQQYTNAQFDARNQLLDFLAGQAAAYAEAERLRKLAELEAQRRAAEDYARDNPDATGAVQTVAGQGQYQTGPFPFTPPPPPPAPRLPVNPRVTETGMPAGFGGYYTGGL